MMPEECPSMRSMARWVLPVLVGPSTAVTPAPRAPELRLVGEEKEMGISRPIELVIRMFRARVDYDSLAALASRCAMLTRHRSSARIDVPVGRLPLRGCRTPSVERSDRPM